MRSFRLRLPTAPGSDDGSDDGSDVAAELLDVVTSETLYIPRVLERDGLAGYEPSTLACFLALLERHPGPVFDVGANVGVFALIAAAVQGAEATAFEPVPELSDAARAMAARNGLVFPIEEIALGAEDTEATFYLSDVTDSSNSLAEGFRPSERSLTVQVERLDTYVGRTGVVPRVLKLDTETTEPDVLTGGAATIREHRPWIICEVLAGRTEAKLEHLLADLDYGWYQITEERRLVARREIFGDRSYRFSNWLLAPEPPDDELWAAMRRWRDAVRACTPVARDATPGT